MRPIPPDYDEQPDRFRTARAVVHDYAVAADIDQRVAERLLAEGLTRTPRCCDSRTVRRCGTS